MFCSFKVKLFCEFTPHDDTGFLIEWIDQENSKIIDCGELNDLELYTGDEPVVVQEADKKDPKKDVKGKKKNENTLEAGKLYKGFYQYEEDDVKIDEVPLVLS